MLTSLKVLITVSGQTTIAFDGHDVSILNAESIDINQICWSIRTSFMAINFASVHLKWLLNTRGKRYYGG